MMKEKYETLPLTTLKELAKARGLKGISTMKKAQVIELMLQDTVGWMMLGTCLLYTSRCV